MGWLTPSVTHYCCTLYSDTFHCRNMHIASVPITASSSELERSIVWSISVEEKSLLFGGYDYALYCVAS